MQDCYIGDIGDYGKYGLLRQVTASGLSLAINWYKVDPGKIGEQADGKYTDYLSRPQHYRAYDTELFDVLHQLVYTEADRRIERIESAHLLNATFYAKECGADRSSWHHEALEQTKGANVVFLDPDNGLETHRMNLAGKATEKHVKWPELKDYYVRGQDVILYQHRPQMMKKERCIESVMAFQREYLQADTVMLLEFPKYTNRFYFMFLHKKHLTQFQAIYSFMINKWGKNQFCRGIVL